MKWFPYYSSSLFRQLGEITFNFTFKELKVIINLLFQILHNSCLRYLGVQTQHNFQDFFNVVSSQVRKRKSGDDLENGLCAPFSFNFNLLKWLKMSDKLAVLWIQRSSMKCIIKSCFPCISNHFLSSSLTSDTRSTLPFDSQRTAV